MRTPFMAGNWKMNKTIAEARTFMGTFLPLIADVDNVDMAICGPYLTLPALVESAAGSPVGIGAQNCYWEASGAFTGEVAPGMVKEAGCRYVIIGHSERRQYFGETNETVNRRVKAALAAGLELIVCIGETLDQREAGVTEKICEEQLRGGLAGLTTADMERITLAYEPVWAIGTGKTASPAQAQDVHAFCRTLLGEIFSSTVAEATRIQYGGSVKPANVKELMGQADIDGALVGGASLEAESFAAIVKQ